MQTQMPENKQMAGVPPGAARMFRTVSIKMKQNMSEVHQAMNAVVRDFDKKIQELEDRIGVLEAEE